MEDNKGVLFPLPEKNVYSLGKRMTQLRVICEISLSADYESFCAFWLVHKNKDAQRGGGREKDHGSPAFFYQCL